MNDQNALKWRQYDNTLLLKKPKRPSTALRPSKPSTFYWANSGQKAKKSATSTHPTDAEKFGTMVAENRKVRRSLLMQKLA
jgi:hypothetical protein